MLSVPSNDMFYDHIGVFSLFHYCLLLLILVTDIEDNQSPGKKGISPEFSGLDCFLFNGLKNCIQGDKLQ